jgi:hypothetical protein
VVMANSVGPDGRRLDNQGNSQCNDRTTNRGVCCEQEYSKSDQREGRGAHEEEMVELTNDGFSCVGPTGTKTPLKSGIRGLSGHLL